MPRESYKSIFIEANKDDVDRNAGPKVRKRLTHEPAIIWDSNFRMSSLFDLDRAVTDVDDSGADGGDGGDAIGRVGTLDDTRFNFFAVGPDVSVVLVYTCTFESLALSSSTSSSGSLSKQSTKRLRLRESASVVTRSDFRA